MAPVANTHGWRSLAKLRALTTSGDETETHVIYRNQNNILATAGSRAMAAKIQRQKISVRPILPEDTAYRSIILVDTFLGVNVLS